MAKAFNLYGSMNMFLPKLIYKTENWLQYEKLEASYTIDKCNSLPILLNGIVFEFFAH